MLFLEQPWLLLEWKVRNRKIMWFQILWKMTDIIYLHYEWVTMEVLFAKDVKLSSGSFNNKLPCGLVISGEKEGDEVEKFVFCF